jgi:uncharacterized protein
MKLIWDEAKRQATLILRELDFASAAEVFATSYLEFEDDRFDYGENRYITFGFLDGRSVALVWTQRDNGRRIISMRHVHEEELEARRRSLD